MSPEGWSPTCPKAEPFSSSLPEGLEHRAESTFTLIPVCLGLAQLPAQTSDINVVFKGFYYCFLLLFTIAFTIVVVY